MLTGSLAWKQLDDILYMVMVNLEKLSREHFWCSQMQYREAYTGKHTVYWEEVASFLVGGKIIRCFGLIPHRARVFSIICTTIFKSFLFSLPLLFCLLTRSCYTEGFSSLESQTELNV